MIIRQTNEALLLLSEQYVEIDVNDFKD